jgi:hypothetical protein
VPRLASAGMQAGDHRGPALLPRVRHLEPQCVTLQGDVSEAPL